MAKPIHSGLKSYCDAKLAELNRDNEGRDRPFTHYVLQFVVDAQGQEVYCSTRYIRPGAAHVDIGMCHQDLVDLFNEHGDADA